MRRILLLIAALIFVLVAAVYCYWRAVAHFIPNLTDRGLFGDSFGALNVIFSGIALIGVVYALHLQQRQLALQKKENDENLSLMRAQLREMQRSIQMQYQPVLQLQPRKLIVDKPSLFTSPDEDGCHSLSRYHLDFELRNASDTPEINAVVSSILIATAESSEEKLISVGSHFSVITQDFAATDKMIFVPDKPYVTFFEAIRDKDASKIPTIDMIILHRNLMGGCFQIRQAFHILLGIEDSLLSNWQTAITSFPTIFKCELRKLRDLEKEPSRWYECFNDMKSKFVEGIDGPDEIDLPVVVIPGSHVAKHIEKSEYDEMIGTIGFPQHTFAHTKCLFKKE